MRMRFFFVYCYTFLSFFKYAAVFFSVSPLQLVPSTVFHNSNVQFIAQLLLKRMANGRKDIIGPGHICTLYHLRCLISVAARECSMTLISSLCPLNCG